MPIDTIGNPLWKTCSRLQPYLNEDGSQVDCTRAHLGDYRWKRPDLKVTFVYSDYRTPFYLELPPGYKAVVKN